MNVLACYLKKNTDTDASSNQGLFGIGPLDHGPPAESPNFKIPGTRALAGHSAYLKLKVVEIREGTDSANFGGDEQNVWRSWQPTITSVCSSKPVRELREQTYAARDFQHLHGTTGGRGCNSWNPIPGISARAHVRRPFGNSAPASAKRNSQTDGTSLPRSPLRSESVLEFVYSFLSRRLICPCAVLSCGSLYESFAKVPLVLSSCRLRFITESIFCIVSIHANSHLTSHRIA